MENQIIAVGAASSLVTEVLKLIPFLRSNAITIAVTNIVVVAAGVYLTSPKFDLISFVEALGVSIATYLAAVKPLATQTGSRSQD
jgi:hypothetical protein